MIMIPFTYSIAIDPITPRAPLPLVTAIIATYNRAYIVCEAIDSILQQTYPHIEIIVVDDGSTDETRDTLKQYGSRIQVLYQSNQGPAAAWNTGIRASQGSIVCFLGSDDLWLPTFVERQISILTRAGNSVPCSITNAFTRWASGLETCSFDLAAMYPHTSEGLWSNVLDIFLTRCVMCGQMFAIRREALEAIGCFDSSLRYLEDYDIALRLALLGPWGYIEDPLVLFRQSTTGDSMSLHALSVRRQLAESMLHIRMKIKAAMDGMDPPMRSRYLARSVRKAQRDRWAALARDRTPIAGRYLYDFYERFDHYSEAAFRRSPFYPRMQIKPLLTGALCNGTEPRACP